MLVRSENPFGKHLKNSQCVFEWSTRPLSVDPRWSKQLTDELQGKIEYLEHNRVRVSIPHEKIDAFGGIYFVKDLFAAGAVEILDKRELSESVVDDYALLFSSFSFSEKDIPKRPQTVTQRFLGELIRSFSWSQEPLAVVVAMDDLNLIDDTNFSGNSLSFVQAQSQRFKQVCDSDAATWRKFLQLRASRALETHEVKSAITPHLVLSSLGNVDRYPWCPKLNSSDFKMFPTPNDPNTANLVIWSHGDTFAVSLAASKAHPVYKDFTKITQIWRGIFHAQ